MPARIVARIIVSPRFELFLALAAVLDPEIGEGDALWLGQARRKLDQATRRRMGDLALFPAIWRRLAAVLETDALEGETDAVIAALAAVPPALFARRCGDALPDGTDPAGLQQRAVDALRRFDRLVFAALWRRAQPDLASAVAAADAPSIDVEDGIAEAYVFPSLFGMHRFRFGRTLVQTLPPTQLMATRAPAPSRSADPEPMFRALGDATRYAIARLIAREPLTGAELARRLDVSGPTLTHHLHRLRAARLVIEERRGNSILLRLDRHAIAALSTLTLETLFGSQPIAIRRSRRR
jgi:DNA-binding transcriptional ArsR family regulator